MSHPWKLWPYSCILGIIWLSSDVSCLHFIKSKALCTTHAAFMLTWFILCRHKWMDIPRGTLSLPTCFSKLSYQTNDLLCFPFWHLLEPQLWVSVKLQWNTSPSILYWPILGSSQLWYSKHECTVQHPPMSSKSPLVWCCPLNSVILINY